LLFDVSNSMNAGTIGFPGRDSFMNKLLCRREKITSLLVFLLAMYGTYGPTDNCCSYDTGIIESLFIKKYTANQANF